jgi:hypothetical protein
MAGPRSPRMITDAVDEAGALEALAERLQGFGSSV